MSIVNAIELDLPDLLYFFNSPIEILVNPLLALLLISLDDSLLLLQPSDSLLDDLVH